MTLHLFDSASWAPVSWTRGYDVSSDGHVRSFRPPNGRGPLVETPRILKAKIDSAGRPCVCIRDSGKKLSVHVHILVLEAFVGPCPPGMEGCHNNGDPADNRLSNLRWDTHASNMADRDRHGRTSAGGRHWNAKLTDRDVSVMLEMIHAGWTDAFLGGLFGVVPEAVGAIRRGVSWRHVQRPWLRAAV